MKSSFVAEVVAKLFGQYEGGVPEIYADGKPIHHVEIVSPGNGYTYLNLMTDKWRGVSEPTNKEER